MYIVLCTLIIFYAWHAFLCFLCLWLTPNPSVIRKIPGCMELIYVCIYIYICVCVCLCVCVCVCVWVTSVSLHVSLPMDNCLNPSYPSSRSRGKPHGFTGCCGKDSNFVLTNNLSLNFWSSRPYEFHCTEELLLTVSREWGNNLIFSVVLPWVEFGTS